MSQKPIFLIAGEASADVYAAKLIRDTRAKAPNIKFYGIGGELMQQAGAEILFNYKNLAIVGLSEVLIKMRQIWRVFHSIKKILKRDRPPVIVLIDYPGFNLRIAKVAHKLGIKVLYYVSPQIWAWHASRIYKIKKYVDHMAVILPFEKPIYEKFNIPVSFVGHPLLDIIKPKMSREAFKTQNKLTSDLTIGLLPGSRLGEIEKLLEPMLKAANLLKQNFPKAQFILPLAKSLTQQDIEPYLATRDFELKIISENRYDAMRACDVIMACSGTVTLEIGLLQIPYVLVYKVSKLNYFLGRHLVKIPFLGLCNVIAHKMVVKELIQDAATPQNIATEIEKIITDDSYRQAMLKNLHEVHDALTDKQGEDLTALLLSMYQENG